LCGTVWSRAQENLRELIESREELGNEENEENGREYKIKKRIRESREQNGKD
jgi:hypothetical protein